MRENINEMSGNEFINYFAETARDCYIKVMGEEMWINATDEEKRYIVMTLANGLKAELES